MSLKSSASSGPRGAFHQKKLKFLSVTAVTLRYVGQQAATGFRQKSLTNLSKPARPLSDKNRPSNPVLPQILPAGIPVISFLFILMR
jgi:hypothetical protein